MKYLAFGIGGFAACMILLTLLVTIWLPARQFWPPGEKSWKYYLHWSLVTLFNLSLVIVAYLDWNTWLFPRPESLIAGGLLALGGAGIFLYSERYFETDETMGLAGDLHTDWPYARSCNPQYVGMIVGMVGFIFLVNSALVTFLGVLNAAWVFLLPFAEEPWFTEEFGEVYQQYYEQVPRFVGLRSFRVP
ncbi:methyltransferase family protein [Halomarina pelagica]|uniref:methyltransferase family protein n=1 Tax=Halomarina pelagica TaxID=2961599 RepID=UPI0020C44A98|nr:methyltransferase [Halomarina sp. BND7]